MKKKSVILSGMRPTGRLHLGNYLGALKNWVRLQDEYMCYYEIADWHALMSDFDNPGSVTELCRDMVCVWLAVGLDPDKCVMFRQSDVSEHLELFFIFATITPLGWLERCPTYKEALQNVQDKDLRNYAFLGYPSLQAADIALYRADKVPVGKDQLPHLELTREIVRRFNHLYSSDVMVEPDEILTEVQKLNGTDGRKMSKSYNNTILITEESADLKKKVSMMITDPERIHPDDKGHPEVCTVYEYRKIFSADPASVEKRCRGGSMGCVECKKGLLEDLEALIAPVREKYRHYRDNPGEVDRILGEGNRKAREAAAANLKKFREAMSFG
ncbi:MAG: tryptophan--tRNA ligase [Elusimicrobia bacterium]|nr:tryptophan--tRNA ligase [Elusimicrobiota bacterium]